MSLMHTAARSVTSVIVTPNSSTGSIVNETTLGVFTDYIPVIIE